MLPGFITRGPLLSDAEVATFEGRAGFRLPPDFRRFLLDQNGGERASALRPEEAIAADGYPRSHRFFSLGAAVAAGLSVDEADDLGGEVAEAWPELLGDLELRIRWCRAGGYPTELLPVAEVYQGDLLLLRLDEPDAGAVYFAFDPDGYCEWHCDRVAGSFADLLRDFEAWEFA